MALLRLLQAFRPAQNERPLLYINYHHSMNEFNFHGLQFSSVSVSVLLRLYSTTLVLHVPPIHYQYYYYISLINAGK